MNQLLKISTKGITLGIFLLSAGCDTVKTELGLDRHTPDEFAVMQRAPLEIPTDLTTLPVPRLGMDRPQDVTAKEQAKEVILGDAVKTKSNTATAAVAAAKPSAAENALVNKVGGATADSQIREKIAAEVNEGDKDNRTVVKRILGIGSDTVGSKVVDAEAEAKRIQDAKKAGKPITEGATPSIED
jgi:hypothetical protein